MKHQFSSRSVWLIHSACLATIVVPVLHGEARCPGNVASVTPRFVQRALIIPVKIIKAGPFDFTVDTRSQVTVFDPSLASELGSEGM